METSVIEGRASVEAVLVSGSRDVEKILVDSELSERKLFALRAVLSRAGALGVPVERVDRSVIDAMTSGKTHGGVASLVGARKTLPVESFAAVKNGFFVMLDGVEDPFNFGQALRAIYAAGADGVVMPERNWMSASSVVARSSAGASEYLPAAVCEPSDAIEAFRRAGYKIAFADDCRGALPMTKAPLARPIFLIIGGEKRGISAKLAPLADFYVRITYGRDFRASLGAAEACAVLAFEVKRQNEKV